MKVPKLRFCEFSGEWEEKKLGEIATNKSKKYNPEKETISYKCIELEHLTSENGQLLGYVDSLNSGSIKNKFNEKDVLFGKLRPYLKKYLLAPFDGVCSSEIWVLSGKNISNNLLYYIIQTEYFIGLANQSSGSKMPRADWNVVENATLYIPSKPEQEKIASFLSSVDTKIEQLTKKKTLLEQYKKGVMQKIFALELRFRDDDGSEYPEWVEKKLGEIGVLTSSKRVYLSDYTSCGVPFYRGKEISELKLGIVPKDILYISQEAYDEYKSKFGVPQIGDILITAVGTLGNVLRINDNSPFYFKDGNLIWIKDIQENSVFLEILLEVNSKDINKTSIGSTQRALTMVELRKLKFIFPSKPEQTKIANFLSSLDSKLWHVETQLNSTKQFKKALLQKMFV